MRFWIKIGLLFGIGYLACNASFLLQDRREHHAVVRDVEAVTRAAASGLMAGQPPSQIRNELSDAQSRLNVADARWKRDASHLLLGSN